MKKVRQKEVIVYQAKSGAIELRGDFEHENIWATQAQIAQLFKIERSVVTKHIGAILKTKEVEEKSNVQKMHIANSDKPVSVYSLDIILSVGYRSNSARAIDFRKWATKVLRENLTKGYTINRMQVGKNYDAFLRAVNDVQTLLPEHITLDLRAILELVKEFSSTWVSLDAYDKGALTSVGTSKKTIALAEGELTEVIFNLRSELIKKGVATDIFAQERVPGSIEGIIGNVLQSFEGSALYPTIEEKAAHLLYFIIKDHPFVDGNKRSGAFAFIWFLRKAKAKSFRKINPGALTALTLLIAESDPEKKDQMVALVTQILK
jgi:prophage antirepressor-like protein